MKTIKVRGGLPHMVFLPGLGRTAPEPGRQMGLPKWAHRASTAQRLNSDLDKSQGVALQSAIPAILQVLSRPWPGFSGRRSISKLPVSLNFTFFAGRRCRLIAVDGR